MIRQLFRCVGVVFAVASAAAQSVEKRAVPERRATEPPRPVAAARAADRLRGLPLMFERNEGQADPAVKYLSHGAGYTLFLTDDETVVSLGGRTDVRLRHVGA